MVTHQLWELDSAGSIPVAPTRRQLRERVVEFLFLNPKPHTFYQIRAGLELPPVGYTGEGSVAVLPILYELRATGAVRRIDVAVTVNQSPRFVLTVTAWLKLARERAGTAKQP